MVRFANDFLACFQREDDAKPSRSFRGASQDSARTDAQKVEGTQSATRYLENARQCKAAAARDCGALPLTPLLPRR